jgi:hypothetical protein
MELRPAKQGDGKEIVFTTSAERLVVGSAYLEKLAKQARTDGFVMTDENTPSYRRAVEFAGVRTNPQATAVGYEVGPEDVADLATTVGDFANNTPDAVRDVVDAPGAPIFENGAISRRLNLGMHAGILAAGLTAASEAMAAQHPVAPAQ